MLGLSLFVLNLQMNVVVLILGVYASSLILNFITNQSNFRITEYKYALTSAVIDGLAGYWLSQQPIFQSPFTFFCIAPDIIAFLLVNLATDIVIVKVTYREDWKKSEEVGVAWWGLNLIIAFILMAFVTAIPPLRSLLWI